MTEPDPYWIRVIAEAHDCPNDETCFVLGEVLARPGKVQAVARLINDPELLAAYRPRVGPGEVLVEFDKADISAAAHRC